MGEKNFEADGTMILETWEQKRNIASAIMYTLDSGLSAEIDLRVSMNTIIRNCNPVNVSDVATIFRESGKYEVEQSGSPGTYFHTYIIRKKKKKSFWERNPFWDKVRTGFITFLFSVGAAILLYYILPPRAVQNSSQENQRSIPQNDPLNKSANLQQDSLNKKK